MLDKRTVKRMAFLSRIKIEEEKLDSVREDFIKILEWAKQLSEVETCDVEPLISVNENVLSLREDKVTDGSKAKEVLKNAPDAEYGYFAVPKVIE